MAEGGGEERATGVHTSTTDVFLSYASPDNALANSIVENLEQHGLRCWMAPRDVKPGTVYAEAIVRAINDAKALVLVLSTNAMASSHAGREVERAASKRKQIIAFRVDAAPLSEELEYFLSNSQWIDVPVLGMPAAMAKLKEAVGQVSVESEPANPRLRAELRPVRKRAVGVAKGVAVAAAVVGVGVALTAAIHFWHLKRGEGQAPTVASISDKSIAVLPFVDMSEKHDQEYFGDGMAEEILDLLTKIPGLTVIGRTSSFQFKGKNEDLRTIGEKLNAAYVLEGSVRNAGDELRVTAQLINTKTGAQEWSQTYDRHISDALKLQDEIAAAVARELQLTVAPGYLSTRATVSNPDAYTLMLRGRHAADRWDKEGFYQAVTLYQRALDLDPNSSDAAAELAFTYYQQGVYIFIGPTVAFEQARHAATTALTLDLKNARAHYVLGKIHLVYDWDWAGAEQEFKQAATLAPGSADPQSGDARLLFTLGRWDDALQKIKAALAVDPLDPNSFQYLGMIQARRGHLPEAEAALRRLLDIRATYGWGHFYFGMVRLAQGERDAALVEVQKETVEDAQEAGVAIAYHALGRKTASDAVLARLIEQHANGSAFEISIVYAFRGESDEAMHWLERAYAQKDADLYSIKFDLPVRSLEGDPRFKAFLKKMNLPE